MLSYKCEGELSQNSQQDIRIDKPTYRQKPITSQNTYVDAYQDTGISKGYFMFYGCALKSNNNKDDFQNRIGGFYQDKFEMTSQHRGTNSKNPKTKC